ncbi:MAG: GH3 auxin-responsive promoter family protein [Phycisphaeraceae bacterium]
MPGDTTACQFSREHGITGTSSVEALRRRVPVRRYDGMTEYIDRIRAGEQGVLTVEPVLRLTPSSGSTAACKLIPYTASLLREFGRAIGPWIVDLFGRHPELMDGPAYWSVSPACPPPAVQSAVPVGFDDDGEYLGGLLRWLVDTTLAVPASVRHIREHDAWLDATLDSLVRARELRLISVWHPSFLTLLLDALRERRGVCDWRAVWPKLSVVSCWTDGHAAGAARLLGERLPGVTIEPKGLMATEAFVTFPFGGQRPVAICSHYYEFIDDSGQPHLVDELEQEHEYTVVITTGGGLWRYALGDRVRVDGMVDRTPSLRFVGRADHVSDRRGEKLSEGFVTQVTGQLCAAAGIQPVFMLLAPQTDHGGSPYYVLFVQVHEGSADGLASQLDAALCANPHYAYCRRLGQLGPAQVCPLPRAIDAHGIYLRAMQQRGQRLGDIKPSILSDQADWKARFMESAAAEAG